MSEPNQDRNIAPRKDDATDIALSAYGLLRLQPNRWRQLLQDLLSPAMRMHRLRDARTRLWTELVSAADCQRLVATMTSICDKAAPASGTREPHRECHQ